MRIDRRKFLFAMSLFSSTILPIPVISAKAADVSLDALGIAGPLGDRVLGAPDAPVVFIEYASLTCNHCANFHKNGYRHLKAEYIDKGLVYFIYREFSLNSVDLAANMFARCVDEEKYFDVIEILFDNQRQWAFSDDPYEELLAIARQIGFSQEQFDACVSDQRLLEGVDAVGRRAASEFDVKSTPTFFINGERKRGVLSAAELDTVINSKL